MDEIINIKDYKNLDILEFKYTHKYLIVCLVILTMIVIMLLNINVNFMYENKLLVQKNCIITLINIEDIDLFNRVNYITIGNKKYNFKIQSLSIPKKVNNDFYQELRLTLNNFNSTENEVIPYSINYESKKVFKIVKEIFNDRRA